ncbi:MAG: hypothetical protein LC800_07585, partial [Acidobacteria bacterium]|nr:hypothetical protein [Acidobacteriota bacterium]
NAATEVDETKAVWYKTGYDTNGSVVLSVDPEGRRATVSYADGFSIAGLNGNRFAYPTRVTDADGFSSKATYSYDLGAVTESQTPMPDQTAPNVYAPVRTMTYDKVGRLIQVTSAFNGAYARRAYPASLASVQTYTLLKAGPPPVEAFSSQVFDGAGRVRAASRNMAGSNRHSGQKFVYDVLGRLVNQSNPTEMTGAWVAAGDDASLGANWVFSEQRYDWKGRPSLTVNADGTQRSASYGGCGCAGGEVVTLTEEAGRRRRVTHDVMGRAVKTEVLNWNGSVYSTTTNRFNARDQVTRARAYQGQAPSPEPEAEGQGYQTATYEYDGFGRLRSTKEPSQTAPSIYNRGFIY